jgi:hypothetical protein
MADGHDFSPAPASTHKRSASKRRWLGHPWVRALHRDLGFLVIGLTVIYAVSGLAVNHVADWDPNFQSYEQTRDLGALHGDDQTVARTVLNALGIHERPSDVFREGDTLDITLDKHSVHVALATGHVVDQGQKPRFFLRIANFLHLNRGKPAWRYIADAYAVILLFLAGSGMFMIPGKRGVRGRGLVFVLAGIAVPVLYVVLSS